MLIKKALAGNVTGYRWEANGSVVEVPDELGEQLLKMPNGGFTVAESRYEHYREEIEEEQLPPIVFIDVPIVEDEPPKRKTGRPAMPRDERGRIIREK